MVDISAEPPVVTDMPNVPMASTSSTAITAPILPIEGINVDEELEKMPEYHEILVGMIMSNKGAVVGGGKYKCNHCTINRKNIGTDRPSISETGVPIMDCGCSRNKVVAEKVLVNRGIIGRVGNERVLHSLSEVEWYKVDHIMGALFGYNTTWLLDPKIMKEGLLKAAQEL